MKKTVEWEKINLFFTYEELTETQARLESGFCPLKSIPDDYTKAIAIIGRVYAEKLDKSGNIALGHFIRVSDCLDTDDEKVVGLLHDVVEDKYITLNDLKNLGFSQEVIDAVAILTRDKEIYPEYEDYITSIIESKNYIALKVKLFDMLDNKSPYRINDLNEEKKKKALNKYKNQLPRVVIAIKELEEEQNLKRKRILK